MKYSNTNFTHFLPHFSTIVVNVVWSCAGTVLKDVRSLWANPKNLSEFVTNVCSQALPIPVARKKLPNNTIILRVETMIRMTTPKKPLPGHLPNSTIHRSMKEKSNRKLNKVVPIMLSFVLL